MPEISSQGSKFSVQSGPLGTAIALNAATKAKPCVVTCTATPTGIAVGDFIVTKNTTWPSIDNRPLLVKTVAALAVTLDDTDSALETATFPAAGATLAEITWAEVCMVTLTFTTPAGSVIDTTTLCDIARQSVSGLPGLSTWSATGYWDSQDANQKILRDYLRSGANVAFKSVWRDGSGIAFIGSVNTMDVRAGIDQAVGITIGGNVAGAFTYIDYGLAGTPFMAEPAAMTPPPDEPVAMAAE